MEEDSDDEYGGIFEVLSQLSLGGLKEHFKKQRFKDKVVYLFKKEEDLWKVLAEGLKVPLGDAIQISNMWFENNSSGHLVRKSRRESQLPDQKEREFQKQNVNTAPSPQTASSTHKGKLPKTTTLELHNKYECADNSMVRKGNDFGKKEVAISESEVPFNSDKEYFNGNQQMVSSSQDSPLSDNQEREKIVMTTTQSEEAVTLTSSVSSASHKSCELEKQEENHDLAVKEIKPSSVEKQKHGSPITIVEVDQSQGCQTQRRPEGSILSVVHQTRLNELADSDFCESKVEMSNQLSEGEVSNCQPSLPFNEKRTCTASDCRISQQQQQQQQQQQTTEADNAITSKKIYFDESINSNQLECPGVQPILGDNEDSSQQELESRIRGILNDSSDKLTQDKRAKTVSEDDNEPVSSTSDDGNSTVGHRKQLLQPACGTINAKQLSNKETPEKPGSEELVAANRKCVVDDDVGNSISKKKKKKKNKKKKKEEELGTGESENNTLPIGNSHLHVCLDEIKEPTGKLGGNSVRLEEALEVREGCDFESSVKEAGSSAVNERDKPMEKQVSIVQNELNQDQVCEEPSDCSSIEGLQKQKEDNEFSRNIGNNNNSLNQTCSEGNSVMEPKRDGKEKVRENKPECTQTRPLEEKLPLRKFSPRQFGTKGRESKYPKGGVLDVEENREVEFKSLTGSRKASLPWKVMEKAKRFICGCLNADKKGIIYFGVGDCQEQNSKFRRGEILGLDVESQIDDVVKAFQAVLDDHIKSDSGRMQKGGDQNCVNIEFVPVFDEGSRSNLYVIEVEVSRDWKFCKDNIYYPKLWKEKRSGSTKQAEETSKRCLSDWYKVMDEWEGIVIRTNGSTASVPQHEGNKQVRGPLVVKHKEWKKHSRAGHSSEAYSDNHMAAGDIKSMSATVHERLRGLDFKEYGYILFANKLAPEYRGSPLLSFLQNIPFVAVFDPFDPATKKDGLYHVCNESSDAPRAKIKTLDDFKEGGTDWLLNQNDILSVRGTTWVLQTEAITEAEWIVKSKDCMYRALTAYKACFSLDRLNCVFLLLSENAIPEMSDIIECCFSILGESASNCLTILCEKKEYADILIENSKRSLRSKVKDCCIAGIPWKLVEQNVKDMIGPSKFEGIDATTELPYYNGRSRKVLNKVINSWKDLEVYPPEPKLATSCHDIEKARNKFYKGDQVKQLNLFNNHDITRTLEKEVSRRVDDELRELQKPISEFTSHVKVVTVPYEPGSGVSTLCRRILWNKREQYRCAVVKALTPSTDYQVEELMSVLHDVHSIAYASPVLILVDNFLEAETNVFIDKLVKRESKPRCVILTTSPVSKSNTNILFNRIPPLRQLDQKELNLVKEVLINVTQSDLQRRRGVEMVLEREKRFLWFGLELFGREYFKIEERLKNHIDSILLQNSANSTRSVFHDILRYCCFLYVYSNSRVILPHTIISDMLYYASGDKATSIVRKCVHDNFGGLLLDDHNETFGFDGWRPAHPLVAEVVINYISLHATAMDVLENLFEGQAYVTRFLTNDIVKTFLDRVRFSDPVVLLESTEESEHLESDGEDEVYGISEVRSKYSKLIMDIMNIEQAHTKEQGLREALEVLITLCNRTSDEVKKAYAWQQLARFIGREIGPAEVNEFADLIRRMIGIIVKHRQKAVNMPSTGFDAAHLAVDMATTLHPTQTHHYVTKGFIEMLHLRFLKDRMKQGKRQDKFAVVKIATETCRRAMVIYEKAVNIAESDHNSNKYPVIGQLQHNNLLLEIVKALPCFSEGSSFTRYLKKEEMPSGMEELDGEDHEYIQGFMSIIQEKLNGLFHDVKVRQIITHDETEKRHLNNAKIMASECRRKFYEVTGLDRSALAELPSTSGTSQPEYCEQVVQDILFRKDENPYSEWKNINLTDVVRMYNILKDPCINGRGTPHAFLICCKACLCLETKPPLEELKTIIGRWTARHRSSEWAHLFNYMVHFPIPNGSLDTNVSVAKESAKKCDALVKERRGGKFSRKSRPEYFLGRGRGLDAFVSANEISQTEGRSEESKTHFWRSSKVSGKLERLRGHKAVLKKGVINYQGIQVRFDEFRYPDDSKDDLWFHLGFSVAGPYAYDPVNNDTFESMKATSQVQNQLSIEESDQHPFRHDSSATSRPLTRRKANAGQKSVDPFLHTMTRLSSLQRAQRLPTVYQTSGGTLSEVSQTMVSSLGATAQKSKLSYAKALNEPIVQSKSPLSVSLESQPKKASLDVKGKQLHGQRTLNFKMSYEDADGRMHHGAFVLGARKSKECDRHSQATQGSQTDQCSFAHSWRGDTLQHVCTKCTQGEKKYCSKKTEHEKYIYNLGPYLTRDGNKWKK